MLDFFSEETERKYQILVELSTLGSAGYDYWLLVCNFQIVVVDLPRSIILSWF